MQDKKFFLLALALENATQKQLDTLMAEIKKIVGQHVKGGRIMDEHALSTSLDKVINKFYDVFVEKLTTTVHRVGQAKVDQALDDVIPMLREAGLFTEATAFLISIRNYAIDVEKRLMYSRWAKDGTELGTRIKTLRAGTLKTVQNIIANGMQDGLSAKQIAKEIEAYVNPVPGTEKAKPAEIYRKRFGRPKGYPTPKGMPAGTIQYNAMRIARTETANVYRRATVEFYKNRRWVKGFKWILSNSHPRPDVCDDYAAVTYSENNIPTAHPHCLCDIEPILMTEEELESL